MARHARAANEGRICYDWQHYIALVQRKPGAWDELTTYEGKSTDVGIQTSRWLIEHLLQDAKVAPATQVSDEPF